MRMWNMDSTSQLFNVVPQLFHHQIISSPTSSNQFSLVITTFTVLSKQIQRFINKLRRHLFLLDNLCTDFD